MGSAHFGAELKERGYFTLGCQILDASIVKVPRSWLTWEGKRPAEELPI
ncbi:hypothetical protein [Azospirillum humicireducens]|nr:hypothetical protein [Azospirillum humicireducens]